MMLSDGDEEDEDLNVISTRTRGAIAARRAAAIRREATSSSTTDDEETDDDDDDDVEMSRVAMDLLSGWMPFAFLGTDTPVESVWKSEREALHKAIQAAKAIEVLQAAKAAETALQAAKLVQARTSAKVTPRTGKLKSKSSSTKTLPPPTTVAAPPPPPIKRLRTMRVCKHPSGCLNQVAITSSSFCAQHVGLTHKCEAQDCSRHTLQGNQFCQYHLTLQTAKNQPQQKDRVYTSVQPGRWCNFEDCKNKARNNTMFCIAHGGGTRCNVRNCCRASRDSTGFCVSHGGGKRCSFPACTKSAIDASMLCIMHGGGKRCTYEGCTNSADSLTTMCIRHGGGLRCGTVGCTKSAIGKTGFCVSCGGGQKCLNEKCSRRATSNLTKYCRLHGGGTRRCAWPRCTKAVHDMARFCPEHCKESICKFVGCNNIAIGIFDFCKVHATKTD